MRMRGVGEYDYGCDAVLCDVTMSHGLGPHGFPGPGHREMEG